MFRFDLVSWGVLHLIVILYTYNSETNNEKEKNQKYYVAVGWDGMGWGEGRQQCLAQSKKEKKEGRKEQKRKELVESHIICCHIILYIIISQEKKYRKKKTLKTKQRRKKRASEKARPSNALPII